MNSGPTLSNRLGFLATIVAAFIVPWWSLALAGMIQLNVFPAAVIPFGLNRIVLAYLAMAFPFCWLASAAMEQVVRPKTWVGKAVLAMLGLVAALVTVQWGPILTGGNAEPDVDLVERHVIRIIWILLLQFAWVWLARLLCANGIASSESDADGPRSLDFLIAISLLVFAPLAYGDYEMGRQFTVLQNAMRNSQKRTAWEVATRLLALGPTKNLATTVANQPDPWASAK
ncbi:MAG: hypothetical protein KDA87_22030, partial [Planctomycetales bacterium]|nr:hypothetical protein [Planctomycetales bacterium]